MAQPRTIFDWLLRANVSDELRYLRDVGAHLGVTAPLAATAIAVGVEAHAVTHSGQVRSAAERRQAGDIARVAAGVSDPRNNLTNAA